MLLLAIAPHSMDDDGMCFHSKPKPHVCECVHKTDMHTLRGAASSICANNMYLRVARDVDGRVPHAITPATPCPQHYTYTICFSVQAITRLQQYMLRDLHSVCTTSRHTHTEPPLYIQGWMWQVFYYDSHVCR